MKKTTKFKYEHLTLHERINAKRHYNILFFGANKANHRPCMEIVYENSLLSIINQGLQGCILRKQGFYGQPKYLGGIVKEFHKTVHNRKLNVELFAICTSLRLKHKLFGKEAKQLREILKFTKHFQQTSA